MQTVSGDLMAVINGAVNLQKDNVAGQASVSLLKKAMDTEKMIGNEIAKMLGVGVNFDASA